MSPDAILQFQAVNDACRSSAPRKPRGFKNHLTPIAKEPEVIANEDDITEEDSDEDELGYHGNDIDPSLVRHALPSVTGPAG